MALACGDNVISGEKGGFKGCLVGHLHAAIKIKSAVERIESAKALDVVIDVNAALLREDLQAQDIGLFSPIVRFVVTALKRFQLPVQIIDGARLHGGVGKGTVAVGPKVDGPARMLAEPAADIGDRF